MLIGLKLALLSQKTEVNGLWQALVEVTRLHLNATSKKIVPFPATKQIYYLLVAPGAFNVNFFSCLCIMLSIKHGAGKAFQTSIP